MYSVSVPSFTSCLASPRKKPYRFACPSALLHRHLRPILLDSGWDRDASLAHPRTNSLGVLGPRPGRISMMIGTASSELVQPWAFIPALIVPRVGSCILFLSGRTSLGSQVDCNPPGSSPSSPATFPKLSPRASGRLWFCGGIQFEFQNAGGRCWITPRVGAAKEAVN